MCWFNYLKWLVLSGFNAVFQPERASYEEDEHLEVIYDIGCHMLYETKENNSLPHWVSVGGQDQKQITFLIPLPVYFSLFPNKNK